MLTSQKRNKKQNSLCPKYTLFIVNVKRFSSVKTGYFLEKVNRRKLLLHKDLGRRGQADAPNPLSDKELGRFGIV